MFKGFWQAPLTDYTLRNPNTPEPMPPFHHHSPTRPSGCVVFASPHSARDYPEALRRHSVLDLQALRSSEDAYVDLLLRAAPEHGAHLLLGGAPRAYVDYNRAACELDPALVDGVPRGALNPRVAAGLGVIPRVVARGRAIYRGKLPRTEAEHRLNRYWRPYHAKLKALMVERQGRHGLAVLLDFHSMPHEAVAAQSRGLRRHAQVVIGDRFGASAAPWIVDRIEAVFRAAGLRVARNTPFAGAYMVQAYGRPSQGMHAVQIEIDRALYLDEARVQPHPGFGAFQQTMDGIVAELAGLGSALGDTAPLAAE